MGILQRRGRTRKTIVFQVTSALDAGLVVQTVFLLAMETQRHVLFFRASCTMRIAAMSYSCQVKCVFLCDCMCVCVCVCVCVYAFERVIESFCDFLPCKFCIFVWLFNGI
jgi:hypothetical protein